MWPSVTIFQAFSDGCYLGGGEPKPHWGAINIYGPTKTGGEGGTKGKDVHFPPESTFANSPSREVNFSTNKGEEGGGGGDLPTLIVVEDNTSVDTKFFSDLFRLPPPPPSLVGAYYLHTQTHVQYFYIMSYYVMARALLLGEHNVLGAQTPFFHVNTRLYGKYNIMGGAIFSWGGAILSWGGGL